MSRVGKKPVPIPAGVTANVDGQTFKVKGPKGELKLAELPRNSSATRIRNRCEITGRPRAYYRKHKLSRIALRELGSKGMIPGLLKSSW